MYFVQPQRKGTGFTNLARVMQASQGSKLGQTIAGGITGQAQQVQSGIKTAQDEFQKEAESLKQSIRNLEENITTRENRLGFLENSVSTQQKILTQKLNYIENVEYYFNPKLELQYLINSGCCRYVG